MKRLLGDWIPRHGRAAMVAVVVLLTGLVAPVVDAGAEEVPVPGSCKPHQVHVVNPGCVPALTEAVLEPPETYPNLVPDVQFAYVERSFGPPELHFDTWAKNLGTVALDLLADDPSNPTASTVSQCVAWEPGNVCRERRQVGGFGWHDEHTHFHYQDFATYELRSLLADGTPDYSASGLLRASDKVSFCLFDTTRVREDAFPLPTYTLFCNPFRQGISAGYADIYGEATPGQQLPIDGLADGRYALVVTLNSSGNLYESDRSDNTVELTVELSNGLTEATIVDRRWP